MAELLMPGGEGSSSCDATPSRVRVVRGGTQGDVGRGGQYAELVARLICGASAHLLADIVARGDEAVDALDLRARHVLVEGVTSREGGLARWANSSSGDAFVLAARANSGDAEQKSSAQGCAFGPEKVGPLKLFVFAQRNKPCPGPRLLNRWRRAGGTLTRAHPEPRTAPLCLCLLLWGPHMACDVYSDRFPTSVAIGKPRSRAACGRSHARAQVCFASPACAPAPSPEAACGRSRARAQGAGFLVSRPPSRGAFLRGVW